MNRRRLGILAVSLSLLALLTGGPQAAARPTEPAAPIVTVVRHGGLCPDRHECRSVFRISDTTISGGGYPPRRLLPAKRLALLRAIRAIDPAYLRAHPFRGTCPTAYDGPESVYRFRGLERPLASCAYDLRGVKAVRLVEQLLA